MPLDFELYTYDEQNNTKVGENLLTGNVTDNIIMNVNNQVENMYLLKIRWRETENNYLFSKEIDYVQIILNGTQVD